MFFAMDGIGWIKSDRWMTDSNVCQWYGVQCFDGTEGGTSVGQGGNIGAIQRLILSKNNLRGRVPADISALPSLEVLELHQNGIWGPIQPRMYGMTSLKILYLDGNGFDGALSSELGNLVNLEKFTASENELTGTIPAEICSLGKLTM